MSETFHRIVSLVARKSYLVSQHALQKFANEQLLIGSVLEGVATGRLLEDYPTYHKGPAVLILQSDENGRPLHSVWGIPKGKSEPAVLVTIYRPDPDRWNGEFTQRVL